MISIARPDQSNTKNDTSHGSVLDHHMLLTFSINFLSNEWWDVPLTRFYIPGRLRSQEVDVMLGASDTLREMVINMLASLRVFLEGRWGG